MAGNIKGLTVEIGGDTTKLGKALEDVNKKTKSLSSELGDINRLLKFDPGNADLLAQKQRVLAEAVANTKQKLDTLKEAEAQVQAQFERGEASEEQVRALQREIIATTGKLEAYERAVKETADAMEELRTADGDGLKDAAQNADRAEGEFKDLADAADDVEDGMDRADVAAGAFLGNLAANAVSGAVDFLKEAAEVAREYRTEMGKLDVAFTQSGFSSEAATNAYRELVGVLGETDQSVETANHLAKLTDNEKDLAYWTGDILPGVFATFGDSLPIEGLTEAANETAKVGQVTGPLADALNWAGVSEDAFNESLAKCTTEQERQALITQTLVDLYGSASNAYLETNADIVAANQATDAWNASLAQAGTAVMPLITAIKEIGAALLSAVVPALQAITGNLPVLAVLIAGGTALFIAHKVALIAAAAATQGLTVAQYAAAAAQKALNLVMTANPIGLIIVAITALVAAFVYLWTNCESFRKFWIDLWKSIKNAVSSAINFLKTMPSSIYNAIVGAIDRVRTWGNNLMNSVKKAATDMLNTAKTTLADMPERVRAAIAGAIDRVIEWGANMSNRAKTAMSNVINSVVSTLSTLPSQVASIGANLVTGLWNGISNKFSWLVSQIKSFANRVKDRLASFFGVASPSRYTMWLGEMLDEGLAKGVLDHAGDPINAMQNVSNGVLDTVASELDPFALSYQLQSQAAPVGAASDGSNGLLAKLDRILQAIERGQVITIDGDRLVGATAAKYDSNLGQRRALAARGAV